MEKKIKINKDGVISLYGIDFVMKEGSLEGYSSIEEIAKSEGRSLEFIENILIKYRLLDKNGEFDEDYTKITWEDPPANFPTGEFETTGKCYGFVSLHVLNEEKKFRGFYFNKEFVKKLILNDFSDFKSNDKQEEDSRLKAGELINDVKDLSKRATKVLDCFQHGCSHNYDNSCCLDNITINVPGSCIDTSVYDFKIKMNEVFSELIKLIEDEKEEYRKFMETKEDKTFGEGYIGGLISAVNCINKVNGLLEDEN